MGSELRPQGTGGIPYLPEQTHYLKLTTKTQNYAREDQKNRADLKIYKTNCVKSRSSVSDGSTQRPG